MNDLETRILDYLASRHPFEQPPTNFDIWKAVQPTATAKDVDESLECMWRSGRIKSHNEFIGGRLVTTYYAIRTPTPPVGETLEQA
jgi:hypothetical protein